MSHLIQLRPNVNQEKERLQLYVSGILPEADAGMSYEGRLQIHNNVGMCKVRQIGGSQLPNGHQIYVDKNTMEVVIVWPAYSETVVPITNFNLELGDQGWRYGSGWDVSTNNPIEGSRSLRFSNTKGESYASSRTRVKVTPGTTIHAECLVRQGASSAGNAGAGVALEYRDKDDKVFARDIGGMVMSASNNKVYPSLLDSTVPVNPNDPSGDVFVNPACKGLRNRQNKPVWADSFTWDLVEIIGSNSTNGYELVLEVTDSIGQVAIWAGTIGVYVDLTSRWDTEWHGTYIQISEDTKSFTTTSSIAGDYMARSAISFTRADKVYFEFELPSLGRFNGVGIVNHLVSPNSGVNQNSGSVRGIAFRSRAFHVNATIDGCGGASSGHVYCTPLVAGTDRYMFAWDGPNSAMYLGKNGVWDHAYTNGLYGPCVPVVANPETITRRLSIGISGIFGGDISEPRYFGIAGASQVVSGVTVPTVGKLFIRDGEFLYRDMAPSFPALGDYE